MSVRLVIIDYVNYVSTPKGDILDDDRDMGPLLPWLVRTTWQHGLLDEHVPLALKILGAP